LETSSKISLASLKSEVVDIKYFENFTLPNEGIGLFIDFPEKIAYNDMFMITIFLKLMIFL